MFLIVFLFDKNNSQKKYHLFFRNYFPGNNFSIFAQSNLYFRYTFFLFKLLISFFHNFCEYYLFPVQFFYLRFRFFISHNLFPFQI